MDFVYGPDKGQVRHRANQIINKLKTKFPLDVVKVSAEDLENNKLYRFSKSNKYFSNKLIINLDLGLAPSINLDLKSFSNISSSSANFVLLEGGNLKKNNVLVKNFSLEKTLLAFLVIMILKILLKYTIKEFSKNLT